MSKEIEKKISELDEEAAVYVISVAAQLSGLHPQTLRQYDRLGLVSPDRTSGRNRRYSLRDIALLRNVTKLVEEGINHVGIKRIISDCLFYIFLQYRANTDRVVFALLGLCFSFFLVFLCGVAYGVFNPSGRRRHLSCV